MNKRTIVLATFFVLLASSGGALFIFSRQSDRDGTLQELLNNVGNIHSLFALVVVLLVILHIKGNFKKVKTTEAKYEEKLKQLQAQHQAEIAQYKRSV